MRNRKSLKTKSGLEIFQIFKARSNVFLVTNGKENLLVDTGTRFQYKMFEKRLSRLGFDKINYLILTHSHFDHAGNARKIRKKYKPLMIIHKDEAKNLISGDFLIPEGTSFFPRFLVRIVLKRFSSYFHCDPSFYDLTADEQFDLNVFGFNILLLHTPGHSPGSLSLIIDDEIALVGDSMFGVFPRTIMPPYATNQVQVVESWGKLLKTNCKVFIPSHGWANSRSLVQKCYKRWIKKFKKKGLV